MSIFHVLIHSPDVYNNQSCTSAKTEFWRSFSIPHMDTGIDALVPSSVAFPNKLAGIGVEQLGFELMLLRETSAASSSFTCYIS